MLFILLNMTLKKKFKLAHLTQIDVLNSYNVKTTCQIVCRSLLFQPDQLSLHKTFTGMVSDTKTLAADPLIPVSCEVLPSQMLNQVESWGIWGLIP